MEDQQTADLKAGLRKDAASRRRAAFQVDPDAGQALDAGLAAHITIPPGAAVSGYWPMGEEMDVRPTLHRLHAVGCAIGLPVVMGRHEPLAFRLWSPGMTLVRARFNVEVPPEDSPPMAPTYLLVPLLAFDSNGYRLGYGGGFYDRTLLTLRKDRTDIVAIGVAYAAQEVASVPRGPYDQPLDWLATERWIRPIGATATSRGERR